MFITIFKLKTCVCNLYYICRALTIGACSILYSYFSWFTNPLILGFAYYAQINIFFCKSILTFTLIQQINNWEQCSVNILCAYCKFSYWRSLNWSSFKQTLMQVCLIWATITLDIKQLDKVAYYLHFCLPKYYYATSKLKV